MKAHKGCAGSDCHGDALPIAKPPLSKTLCVSCHGTSEVKHKSGGKCLDCHDVKSHPLNTKFVPPDRSSEKKP